MIATGNGISDVCVLSACYCHQSFFHILRIHGLLAKKGNKPVKPVKYQRGGGGGGLPGGGGGGLKPGEGEAAPLLPLAGGASVIRPETGTRWPLAYIH